MAVTELVREPDTAERLAERLALCQRTVELLQQYGRQLSLASVRGCRAARAEGWQQMRDALEALQAIAAQGQLDIALLDVVDQNLAGQHAVDGLWHGEGDVRRWCELYLKDTAGEGNG